VRTEAWDNAKNEESYELRLMAAVKEKHFNEIIVLAAALWNLHFFEAPQKDTAKEQA
jgi:hypothetical protein